MKLKSNTQQEAKPNQKKRGRSLTRQIAISGNTKASQEDVHKHNPTKQENAQMIKNNKIKNSPSKQIPRQLPSTPKTPSHENTKLHQSHLRYAENEGSQVGSRTPSNHNSVTSSREPTPKNFSSSRESANIDKPRKYATETQYKPNQIELKNDILVLLDYFQAHSHLKKNIRHILKMVTM